MKAIEPQEMAQIMGIPLFQTSYFMPRYPEGVWGNWRVGHMGMGFDHGYYTRQWLVCNTPILMRRNLTNTQSWETWMSLTPHEIESQEPGCTFACGHTVIMGLGMGWIALNAALNPAVEKVTVVERDPDVIDFFRQTGILQQVPNSIGEKIEIVQADALMWQPPKAVNFLFADIWLNLDEPDTLVQVKIMQKNVQARSIYFWGQELTLYASYQRLFGNGTPLTTAGLEQCIREEIKIPLILPWDNGYANRIEAAVRNRRDRGLRSPSLPDN